jgi:hypothetical protein
MSGDSPRSDADQTKHIAFETVKGVCVGAIAAVAGMLTGEILIKSIFARSLKLPALDRALKRDAALFGGAGSVIGGALQFRDAVSRRRADSAREV